MNEDKRKKPTVTINVLGKSIEYYGCKIHGGEHVSISGIQLMGDRLVSSSVRCGVCDTEMEPVTKTYDAE